MCSFQKQSDCVSFPLFYQFTVTFLPTSEISKKEVIENVILERIATSSHTCSSHYHKNNIVVEEEEEVGVGGGGDAVVFRSRSEALEFEFETDVLRCGKTATEFGKKYFSLSFTRDNNVLTEENNTEEDNDDDDVVLCMGRYKLIMS